MSIKFSELTPSTTLVGNDIFPIVRGGANYKATASTIPGYLAGVSLSAVSLEATQIITTNSTINNAVSITQSGLGAALIINDSTNDTSPFIVTNNGHVIIGGTSAPAVNALTVYGDVSAGTDPDTGFGGSFINGNNLFLATNGSPIGGTTLDSIFGSSLLLKANSTYELEYHIFTINNFPSQTYNYAISGNDTFTNVAACIIQDTSGATTAAINTYASNGTDGPIVNLGQTNAITLSGVSVYGQVRTLIQTGVNNTTVSLSLSTSNAAGATPLQGSYRKITLFR